MAFPRIKFTIFLYYFLGHFVLQFYQFAFLLKIYSHSNVYEKFDFCFTDFRKAIAWLCVTHTAEISIDFVVYMEIYLAKEKYIFKPVS